MKHLKLRTWLMGGFGLLLGLLVLTCGLSIYSTTNLSSSIEDIALRRMPNLSNISALETEIYTIRALGLAVFRFERADSQTAKAINGIIDSRKDTWAKIDETFKLIDAVPRKTEDTRKLHGNLVSALDGYRKANIEMDGILSMLAAAASAGDSAQVTRLRTEYDEASLARLDAPSTLLRDALAASIGRQINLAESDGNVAIEKSRTYTMLITALAVIGILCGIFVGIVTLRAVFRQIGGEPAYIQSVMQRVSNADLGVKVDLRPGDTESVLHAISVTIAKLRDIVNLISGSASDIAAASEELSATSEKIAASSENQSQAATSMAASVEQMTVSISHVSNSAADANEMAQGSGAAATEGANTIHSVVADINRVAHDIGDAAKSVEELGEQSREIASVVNIIKEVAEQTNLLALNAAIEAARAGEQGRGFAVVADEVRKLAERTSTSTEDIARIVGQIGTGTLHAVQTMQQQSEGVKTTVELSERAGTTIEKIQEASGSVLNAVSEISLALSEQSTASAEIAKNVESIARMSEDNTIAVREVSQATHSLSSQAAQLQEIVNRFTL